MTDDRATNIITVEIPYSVGCEGYRIYREGIAGFLGEVRFTATARSCGWTICNLILPPFASGRTPNQKPTTDFARDLWSVWKGKAPRKVFDCPACGTRGRQTKCTEERTGVVLAEFSCDNCGTEWSEFAGLEVQ